MIFMCVSLWLSRKNSAPNMKIFSYQSHIFAWKTNKIARPTWKYFHVVAIEYFHAGYNCVLGGSQYWTKWWMLNPICSCEAHTFVCNLHKICLNPICSCEVHILYATCTKTHIFVLHETFLCSSTPDAKIFSCGTQLNIFIIFVLREIFLCN